MKSILMSASGLENDGQKEFWNKTVLQLGFTDTQLKNIITGVAASLSGNAQLSSTIVLPGSPRSLKLAGGASDFATLPNDANILPGTGDFTLEWFQKINSVPANPADGSKLVPVLYWGSFASGSNPLNLDVILNQTGAPTASIAGVNHGTGNYKTFGLSENVSLTEVEHMAFVRKDGVQRFYRRGKRQGVDVANTLNFNNSTSSLLNLGRRLGGGSGNVSWNMDGYLLGMRMTKAARYWTEEFKVPTKFYVP